MENKTSKPTVEFKNVKIVNDTINALVGHFTGETLGEFILEMAHKKVKDNNEKLEEFKSELTKGGADDE